MQRQTLPPHQQWHVICVHFWFSAMLGICSEALVEHPLPVMLGSHKTFDHLCALPLPVHGVYPDSAPPIQQAYPVPIQVREPNACLWVDGLWLGATSHLHDDHDQSAAQTLRSIVGSTQDYETPGTGNAEGSEEDTTCSGAPTAH